MKRSTRIASAAVAAAVSFGVSAPAVAAQQHGNEHDNRNGHHQTAKDDRGNKVDRGARQVLKEIASINKRLTNVVKDNRLKRLDRMDRTAILTNVQSDRAALSELARDARAADSLADLKRVRQDLKSVRGQNYAEAVSLFRLSYRLTAQIEALRAGVKTGSLQATALNEATVHVADARETAKLVTVYSSRSDLRVVRSLLTQAKVNVQAVQDSINHNHKPSEAAPAPVTI